MNKNNNVWWIIAALIIGFAVGWAVYGRDGGSMDTDGTGANGTTTLQDGSNSNPTGSSASGGSAASVSSYAPYTGKVSSDKQYVQLMIANQQAAIVMSQQVLSLNPRSEIATLAKNVISTESSQLKTLKDWLASWK
jgi:uncharacterized protein (DUF305 family)